MSAQLRILFLEDVPTDAELELRELQRAGVDCVTQRVDTKDEFMRALDEFRPDLILSDFSLPTFDGLSALDVARKLRPDTPFLFVSGTIGEERAIESLKRGATDYILKTNLRRLVPAVRRALQDVEERAARRGAERRLKESEERFQMAARATNDAIWDWDLKSNHVWWNEGVEKLFGYSREGVVEHVSWWTERLHPDDRERVLAEMRAVIDGGGMFWSGEYRFMRADGAYAYILDRGYVMRDEQGRAYRMIGAMMDITERKNQEERIARLSRIHAVLSGINSAIVRVREREELFREACRIAVEDGGFKLAWIGLLDKQTLDIRPGAWVGDEKGFLSRIRLSAHADLPQGRGVSGLAIRTRKPVVVNEVASDKRLVHREETLSSGFRSFVVLPLLVESEPIGSLYLYTGEADFFDQDELRLLAELAGDISFALEHIERRERLDYLAYYDALTGLPNRTLFHERLNQAMLNARADGGKVGLIALDLQRFGIINDTLGRHAGDQLLRLVGERLSQALTGRGWAARISANTFAIVLPDIKHEADIAHVLEQEVLERLMRPFNVDREELRIAAKAGVALFPGDGTDTDSLFRNAEAALKKSKGSGSKYLFYAPQMNARIAETLSLENRLRIALLDEQFVLYYQPKMAIASGCITGLEALLRWQSPELGLVSPAAFIPLLEETGMIIDVGRWALGQAVSDYRKWAHQGLEPPPIAVNISALELRQRDFVEMVQRVITQDGNGTPIFDLEITESVIMENIAQSIPALAAIRQMNVGIAIDDFGTGYSSLSYITQLPVTALKIDRSFVVDMASKSDSMAVVSIIISLAHSLNLKVIAEGVETQEQLTLLKLLRCDEMQGYLFRPPLPAELAAALFGAKNAGQAPRIV